MKTMFKVILGATAAAAAVAVAAGTASGSSIAAGPQITGLGFEERDDGSGRRWILDGEVHGAESVAFTTRYGGERASGGARLKSTINKRTWRLEGGNGVVPLIRASLAARGIAEVKVKAEGDGRTDKGRFTIDLTECSMNPPFYPLSCQIKA